MRLSYCLRSFLPVLLVLMACPPGAAPEPTRPPQPAGGSHPALFHGLTDQSMESPWPAVLPKLAQAGPDAPRTQAEALMKDGIQAYIRGDYQDARRRLEAARQLYRGLKDRQGEGRTLGNLGVVHQALGEYAQALQAYEQSRDIARETHDPSAEGQALGNIGRVWDRRGEYAQALQAYRASLALNREAGNPDGEASALLNLGAVSETLGQYDEARAYYEQAQERSRAIQDIRGRRLEGTIWGNLGVVHAAQGEYRKAQEFLQKALDIHRQHGDRQGEGRILTDFGGVAGAQGQQVLALEYFQQALQLRTALQDRQGEGQAWFLIASAYNRLGQPAEALQFAQQALARSTELGDQESVWHSSYETAKALEALGRAAEALPHYDTAANVLETLRGKIPGAEGQSGFLGRAWYVYRDVVTLLLTLHQAEPTRGYDRRAFAYAERGKARAFLAQLAEAGARIRGGVNPKLLEDEQRLYGQLAAARQQLSAAQTTAQRTTAHQRLSELTRQLDTVRQAFYTNNPRYANLHYPKPLTADEVQTRLVQDGEVLLEYFWGARALYLFVIDRTHFQALTLPVQEPEFLKLLVQFLTPFHRSPQEADKHQDDVQAFITWLQGFDLGFAHTLYQQLVQRAVPYLGNAHTLVIVPDGFLHYLPFDLLVTEVPTPAAETGVAFAAHRQVPYLVKKYTVVYAPSASVLRPEVLGHALREPRPPKGLLALAPFGATNRQDLAPVRRQIEQWLPQAGLPRVLVEEVTRQLQEPLRGSLAEVQAITQLKPLRPEFPVVREKATARLLREEAKHYRYIHVSTHGHVNAQYPMASGLLFPDALLHTSQVFDLELHAELVVLSACDTGLGPVRVGEGLVGLTRAFMYAGTPSVVASLWAVNDLATAALMTTFYQHLPRLPKGQALRHAKLALLTAQAQQATWSDTRGQKVTVAYAHPYFWAPFGLFGAWR